MKILIAEDEQLVRNLFEKLLAMKGHQVFLASTGREAVELTRKENVELIFMDIMMPDLDGVEAMKQIKQDKPDLPIVMMSGFALEEKVHEAREMGAYDFMYKPFKMTELMTILTKIENNVKKAA